MMIDVAVTRQVRMGDVITLPDATDPRPASVLHITDEKLYVVTDDTSGIWVPRRPYRHWHHQNVTVH